MKGIIVLLLLAAFASIIDAKQALRAPPHIFAICDRPHNSGLNGRDAKVDGTVKAPVWPFQWNATLAKIGGELDANPIQWTKFYYDYTIKSNRFEFYDHYLNLGLNWTASFVILFANNSIYHIHPLERRCSIRSCNCPVLSPWWLQQFTYKGSFPFRGGIPADFFELAADPSLTYWQRSADRIPLRSTNQANDPGATDYSDVLIGPQDPSLFVIPPYCPPCP